MLAPQNISKFYHAIQQNFLAFFSIKNSLESLISILKVKCIQALKCLKSLSHPSKGCKRQLLTIQSFTIYMLLRKKFSAWRWSWVLRVILRVVFPFLLWVVLHVQQYALYSFLLFFCLRYDVTCFHNARTFCACNRIGLLIYRILINLNQCCLVSYSSIICNYLILKPTPL